VVLDLQEKFGNKWARIATYLAGRTDNDVKNFWSTRQKRLARLRRSPLPGPSGNNLSAKMVAASSPASEFDRVSTSNCSIGRSLSSPLNNVTTFLQNKLLFRETLFYIRVLDDLNLIHLN
jgi:hypothetical protein